MIHLDSIWFTWVHWGNWFDLGELVENGLLAFDRENERSGQFLLYLEILLDTIIINKVVALFDQVLVTERNALELNDVNEEVSAHNLIHCNNLSMYFRQYTH